MIMAGDNQNIDPQKAETLQASCSGCGWEGIVLIPDLMQDYYALCKKCGKKIYGVNCPKCESGFGYSEDDKEINKEQMTWRCDICNQDNPLTDDTQNNLCEVYDSEKELPEEIRLKLAEQMRVSRKATLPIRIIMYVILAGILFFYFWDKFKI